MLRGYRKLFVIPLMLFAVTFLTGQGCATQPAGTDTDQPADQAQAPDTVSGEEVYYPISENGDWGFIDKTGETVIKPQFAEAEAFYEGLAKVKEGDNYGYINTDGEMVIPAEYRRAERFSEGLAAVLPADSDTWGYIDRSGEMVIEPQFTSAYRFNDGLAPVHDQRAEGPGQFGYIDQNGEYIIDPQFAGARIFSEGKAPVDDPDSREWGYVDRDGNYVIEPQFEEAQMFGDGYAPVEIAQSEDAFFTEWGFIDESGEQVFDTYEETRPFVEGYALIEDNFDGWQYLNTDGEVAFEIGDGEEPDMAHPFHNGVAQVFFDVGSTGTSHSGGPITYSAGDGEWGYIDQAGTILWSNR